ncbi:MAG: YraN family protein [Acidobacteriaceae bacterium]
MLPLPLPSSGPALTTSQKQRSPLPFFFSLCYIDANSSMPISSLTRFRLHLFERGLHALDRLSQRSHSAKGAAPHLTTGIRGEEAAYFHLRRLGYVIVARRWRSPKQRGEIDLIGWDGEWLCFIEVKTRSSRAVAPAEAAVDQDKRTSLRRVAREHLRLLENAATLPTRFDVVSVYFDADGTPEIVLFRNAFGWR